MITRALGWKAPTLEQQIRALRGAHPEAGDSILAGIKAAPSSDLSAQTCDLDQGQLGSCTANGIAQGVFVAEMVASLPASVLARLWLYYMERALEGTISQDAGANIGDGYRILAGKGIPPESAYPYDISKFTRDPGPTVDRLAYDSKGALGVNYHPISSTGATLISDVEKALTAKMAVVFGSLVPEYFCSQQPSGTLNTPPAGSAVAGGHCQTVIGHDHANRRFKVKNSWGSDWCDPTAGPGCWWMGYDWFTDSTWGASDIWIVLAIPQGTGK
jgi:C1A family cysteine protease